MPVGYSRYRPDIVPRPLDTIVGNPKRFECASNTISYHLNLKIDIAISHFVDEGADSGPTRCMVMLVSIGVRCESLDPFANRIRANEAIDNIRWCDFSAKLFDSINNSERCPPAARRPGRGPTGRVLLAQWP
jgi:hypothetical protein